ncbi:MAG: glucose-6-phosphate dehydrogenase [Actinomycetota bacterium]|nr:glucose-6-phosphate dehydrogenase [Actinomycetota bacterium]MDQ6948194.1 glucose-6-phosphate dehydrogenase [Actinomycetota bacterium]
MAASRADALVLFGATGDLAKKKLFPALYRLSECGRLDIPVIGVAKSDWDDDGLRRYARAAVDAAVHPVDEGVFAAFAARLSLVGGDYAQRATFEQLASCLEGLGRTRPAHYLAIPPGLFPAVVESLDAVGLNRGARVVVEKPFGRDLRSARELNRVLHRAFSERAIFRIDHYLGKEAVEDLLVFRFANSFLEPIWDRRYISNVEITMAEEFGVEGRGAFYDQVGAIRDVVQNHLLQVVTLLAMEAPVRDDADSLRDEKVRVLKAMEPVDPTTVVRGQYEGYRSEPGVAPESATETFAALRFTIDSWRWAGVPWFVRAGKALATTALEATVELHPPPRMLFWGEEGHVPGPNLLRFRLGADDGVSLWVQAKSPGRQDVTHPVELAVDFASALGHRQEAYERLLDDALDGNPRRFAREDMVEEAWRIVQPALDHPGPVHPYPRGCWGPAQADSLIPSGAWHQPEVRTGR